MKSDSDIKSPCISVCTLTDDLCDGCFRTSEEIRLWCIYDDNKKRDVLKDVAIRANRSGESISDDILYHICSVSEWEAAKSSGADYRGARFDEEGFTHCSYEQQVRRTLDKFFHGQNNIIILKIEGQVIRSITKDEDLMGEGMLFPHVYGGIPISSVISVIPVEEWDKA